MNYSTIDAEVAGIYPPLIKEYLRNSDRLKSLYAYSPDLQGFRNAIQTRSTISCNRTLLTNALKSQYQKSHAKMHTRVEENVRKLNSQDSFTICTGHQPSLFLGPLYTIYKIASVICLANELQTEHPTKQFIPVFWLAGEDHDFDELGHAFVQHKKIEWKLPNGAERSMMGSLGNAGISSLVDEAFSGIAETVHAESLKNLLKQSYEGASSFSSATRLIINELFGAHGLVIIDGNDVQLKTEFLSSMSNDLFGQQAFRYVSQTADAITQMGFTPQVEVKPINLFYIKDGKRFSILKEQTSYVIKGTSVRFSTQELETELQSHPERFSPNVVLRPLYQEKILPNLAYVGGPAETSYWMLYKSFFDAEKVPFPVLLTRASAVMLDEKTKSKLEKTGLSHLDLFTEKHQLIRQFLSNHGYSEEYFEKEKMEIELLFGAIIAKATLIDPTLKASAEAEKAKVLNQLMGLEKKMQRAQKRKEETSVAQIEAICDAVYPNGIFQERIENFMYFYSNYGQGWIDFLCSTLTPLKNKLFLLNT